MLDLTVSGRAPATLRIRAPGAGSSIIYFICRSGHADDHSRTYRCIDSAKDFMVSGTPANQLFGTCESLWEPDLEPEDLFETISQVLLNSMDRDALSGWGAHVYIITKDQVIKRLLKGMYPSLTPKVLSSSFGCCGAESMI